MKKSIKLLGFVIMIFIIFSSHPTQASILGEIWNFICGSCIDRGWDEGGNSGNGTRGCGGWGGFCCMCHIEQPTNTDKISRANFVHPAPKGVTSNLNETYIRADANFAKLTGNKRFKTIQKLKATLKSKNRDAFPRMLKELATVKP